MAWPPPSARSLRSKSSPAAAAAAASSPHATIVRVPPPTSAAARATSSPHPPPSSSSPTMVALPPPPPPSSTTATPATAAMPKLNLASDPNALLDAIDAYGASRAVLSSSSGGASTATTTAYEDPQKPVQPTSQQQQQTPQFDPIGFLNHHYHAESSLVADLPTLRSTVQKRISSLDATLSNTIQRQSETSSNITADVVRAKTAILALRDRIDVVQTKARLSEKAVLDITRDMKRLDCAKRHLQKTVTALKRLHMLLHAAEQLKLASTSQPHPDYKAASHLIDATRLLLGHFESYASSVRRIRDVRDAVHDIRVELKVGIVRGFRVAGFGEAEAMKMEERDRAMEEESKRKRLGSGRGGAGGGAGGSGADGQALATRAAVEGALDHQPAPPMGPDVLADACLVLDALGLTVRDAFIQSFASEHLAPYNAAFDPAASTASGSGSGGSGGGGASAAEIAKKSFKIKIPSTSDHGSDKSGGSGGGSSGGGGSSHGGSNPNPASLDQIERRYAWYRRTLRDLDDKFATVFPRRWNLHCALTRTFLNRTASHLTLLLDPGPYKDRDCANVTVLLKALQKTMLFEKEMTAWLQRDYGTVFATAADAPKIGSEGGGGSKQGMASKGTGGGDDDEPLEFDEQGRAVAASSAEGIKIKYERQKRQRRRKNGGGDDAGGNDDDALVRGFHDADDDRDAAASPGPVPPLLGVASSSFDGHMGPYIDLEEQNLAEQIATSSSDDAVDARGELPVFTSSTNLFVYIKNSITRCTVLTKGKTFFLLHRAFQDALRNYANLLEGKLPPPLSSGGASAIGGISLAAGVSAAASTFPLGGVRDREGSAGGGGGGGGGSGGGGGGGGGSAPAPPTYRIPPEKEVTVCHVIDTCEYCADTVEALEDLIRDKIDAEFKEKIDMSGEQEAFHDVTAKSIRVLVSGLEQRTDGALKEMSSTNWGTLDAVGEESSYVRSMHGAIQPFVVTVRGLIPKSYFRSFCDKFAATFTSSFFNALVRLRRISESGTQQLLLDVYNLKTLLLKLPVQEKPAGSAPSPARPGAAGAGATIPPAMYTKMVTKEFRRIEVLLKLVGTPSELLVEMFKAQWHGGSALDLQSVMNLKGIKRQEQTSLLEQFGVDSATAATAARTSGMAMTENIQAFQDKMKGSDVAARVNSDLSQMRQKVDDFRKAFR